MCLSDLFFFFVFLLHDNLRTPVLIVLISLSVINDGHDKIPLLFNMINNFIWGGGGGGL